MGESDKCRFGNPPQETNSRLGITGVPNKSSAVPCHCSMSTSLTRARRSNRPGHRSAHPRRNRAGAARQDSNGAFGIWSATDADDMWLHAFVTDFLTRARKKGLIRRKGKSMPPWRAAQSSRQFERDWRGTRRPNRLCRLCSSPQRPSGHRRSALSGRREGRLVRDRSPTRISPPRWLCLATARARRRCSQKQRPRPSFRAGHY
jgi:hypothetical protein